MGWLGSQRPAWSAFVQWLSGNLSQGQIGKCVWKISSTKMLSLEKVKQFSEGECAFFRTQGLKYF